MASEIIITLVGLFCTTVSSIVTFILTRRKYNTEVDSQQIINMNEAFDLYKKTMEESIVSQRERMEETIKFQNSKIETLQKENDSLKEQVNNLQKQLSNLVLNLATKTIQPSM
jgi:predicted HTH domain antitoxin